MRIFLLFLLLMAGGRSVAQSCGSILNLPDTLKRCGTANIQLTPIVSTSTTTSFDTFWTPTAGLSNPNVINPVVGTGANTGYYYLHVSAESGSNLVVNGDFSAGNTGFTSDYVSFAPPPGGMIQASQYLVTTNTLIAHSLMFPMNDHTTGTGQMMVVNGAATLNENVWCQTVTVLPNTTYNFAAYVANTTNASPAILQFSINGSALNSPLTISTVQGLWQPINATWFSGSATTAVICLVNQNNVLIGNDFALDDISLRTTCEILDSVFVQNLNPTQSTQAVSLCTGGSYAFGGNTLTTAGTYTHTFTGANSCDSVVTLNLSFQNAVSSTQQAQLCPGATYTFGGNTLSASGIYTHKFTTIGGCDSTVILTLSLANPIQDSQSVKLCPGASYVFAGNTLSSAGVYNHTFTAASGCDSTVTLTLSYINPAGDTLSVNSCRDTSFMFGSLLVDTSGTYFYKFTSVQGCDSPVVLIFNERAVPSVSFFYAPDGRIVNVPVSFINVSTNVAYYGWTFGDNTSSDTANPTHLYLRSGVYTVCLTGWNAAGCTATHCEEIKVEMIINADVPTAFSPNGDGKNDVLWLHGVGVQEIQFAVYNRWGQKLFETNDLSIGWDGTYKGAPVDAEVLVYTLAATFINGNSVNRQGNITLVR